MRYASRAIRLFAVVAVTAGIASCTGPQVRHVVLQCDDGTPLSATYAPDRSSVTIENGGAVTLQVARSASGARYAGPEAEFWEHRGAFRWIRSGKPAVTCVVSTEPGSGAPIGIANPASVHCAEVGGRNVTETLPNGSEFGVCLFEDNRQCGQWALFRGGCPVGGLRITGYPSDAARYCAITGSTYGVSGENETCTTPEGKVCGLAAYFDGTCR